MNDINKNLGHATAYGYAKSKGYTGTEDEFAELMADYADVGERAEAAATAAAASATAASGSASDSAASATAAEGFAGNASTSAGNAAQSASQASQSATAASGSATAAAGSATQAAGSATTAENKATEAAQSATAAAGSATAAESAKTAAQTAQGAAETAQTAAETAQEAAEDAAESVSASAAQIAQNTADISSVKSHLNAIDIVDTASGAIASFADGADGVPMRSVTVAMEPIQDLHGQDAPYPGGSTKNLFNNTAASGTDSEVRFTVKPDFTVVVNGTASGGSNAIYALGTITLEPGNYIISSGIVSSDIYFQIVATGISGINTEGADNYSFTISTTVTATGRIVAKSGKTANNVTIYPMIRKSTEPSGYVPYSNICPISGRSEVGVWRSGVNLFKTSTTTFTGITYTANADGTVTLNGTSTGYSAADVVTTLAAGTYKLCITSSESNTEKVYAQLRNGSTDAYIIDTPVNSNGVEFTLSEETSIKCRVMVNTAGRTFNNVTVYPSLCLSSDIATITIPLGQTVYGGTLDAVSGVMTVDRAMVDLGTLTWSYQSPVGHERFRSTGLGNVILKPPAASVVADIICSAYKALPSDATYNHNMGYGIGVTNTDGAVYVYDATYTDVASFTAAMSGVQLCYALAQPVTVQLTAQQLTTLLGTNNVWSDGGNVSVEYVADTKLYISKVIAAALA